MKCIFCVLSAMFAAFMVITLTGCDMMDGTKDEPYKPIFHFGDDVYVKEGFYKGVGCVVIEEGTYGIICRIEKVNEDGKEEDVKEEYKERLHLRTRDVQRNPVK